MTASPAGRGTAPVELRSLLRHSRELILRSQAPSGALPAAPTYRVYRYCWLRDGAFIAEGLSRQGEVAAAQAFYEWCARVIEARGSQIEGLVARLCSGEQVPGSEMLPTRFTLDGEEGTDEWWDFQTDGYGTWVWALQQHLSRHGGDPEPYRKAVQLTTAYLAAAWPLPCYDWWEEHQEERHLSTLGALDAGFSAAQQLGLLNAEQAHEAALQQAALRELMQAEIVRQGHLVKWVGSTEVDGSLLAIVAPFGLRDAQAAAATVEAVERDLVREGGVYRYRKDTFYGGGRWPVLAGFHGLALARLGRTDQAWEALRWMASTATPEGDLPEQKSDLLLDPDRYDEWVEMWGPVACPLLWSHGMLLSLAAELGMTA